MIIEADSMKETNGVKEERSLLTNEVQQMVISEGPCKNLDVLKIKKDIQIQNSGYIPFYLAQIDESILREAQLKCQNLQPQLEAVLRNDNLLNVLVEKEEDEVLSKEEISISLQESDLLTTERLFYILNHNCDPDLISLVLQYTQQSLPPALLQTADQSEYLRRRLTLLLTNEEYREYLFDPVLRDQPMSESLSLEIKGVINIWLLETHKYNHSLDVNSSRKLLLDYFKASPGSYNAGFLLNELENVTTSTYLRLRNQDRNAINEWQPFPLGVKVLSWVKKHAEAVDIGSYLLLNYKQINELCRTFFSEIYVDPQIEKLSITDPSEQLVGNRSDKRQDPNGAYYAENREVRIDSSTVVSESSMNLSTQLTHHFTGIEIPRIVNDPLTLGHELMHGIYQQIVKQGSHEKNSDDYYDTVDAAFNEGFAVLMELQIIDTIVTNPHLLDFNQQQLEAIQRCKSARMEWLQDKQNAYTEGFQIVNQIFKEQGFKGIRMFLNTINPIRTCEVLRKDPEYQRLLQNGTTMEWLAYLRKM